MLKTNSMSSTPPIRKSALRILVFHLRCDLTDQILEVSEYEVPPQKSEFQVGSTFCLKYSFHPISPFLNVYC